MGKSVVEIKGGDGNDQEQSRGRGEAGGLRALGQHPDCC